MGDRPKAEHRRKQTREHLESMRGQEPAEHIACSFCAKRQSEVPAMFAGLRAVYICNECVNRLAQKVDDQTVGKTPSATKRERPR